MNSHYPGNRLYKEKDDRVDDLCEGSDFSRSNTEDISKDHQLESDIKNSNSFFIGISGILTNLKWCWGSENWKLSLLDDNSVVNIGIISVREPQCPLHSHEVHQWHQESYQSLFRVLVLWNF